MTKPRTPRELMAEWLAGNLEEEGVRELLKLLNEQSDLLEDAARLKCFDRLLHLTMLDAGPNAFVQEVAARCGALVETTPAIDRAVHRRLRWKRWTSLAIAAGVMVMAALSIWWQSRPVAVVTRVQSARWNEGQRTLSAGDALRTGPFTLADGFIELKFRDGAQLIVEGPADFHLISKDLVRLNSGKAFAHVPEPAIGFTIDSPTGRVVDRGTDFGVHVGDNAMEVHVLKGLVDAGRGSALQPVRENEALRMSAGAVKTIPADRARFLTAFPPTVSREIGWVHWAFDEGEGSTTESESSITMPPEAPARLLSLDGADGPKWTTGQFGAALLFDGQDDYVQSDFEGIGGGAARTVAFWVKVPRAFEPKNGYAMVCWGSTQDLKEGWQISVNPKDNQGPIGRLRVARIGGPVIGSTDLRDDRWHHVAVVFFGGDHADRTTQVLMYIDGELERSTRKGMIDVRTDTASGSARKVAFGLNIAPANPDPRKPATWRVFRGCLDEVFICDAALSQEQIRELMLHNHTSAFAPASEF